MVGRTILATLPGSAPLERLQVALVQRPDGRLMIDLREQHYAEGIGWFDQRTMELEPRQFQQLQAALGLKGTYVPPVADAEAPMTIPFPGPFTREPARAAAGDER
jgi:hypothetical protein